MSTSAALDPHLLRAWLFFAWQRHRAAARMAAAHRRRARDLWVADPINRAVLAVLFAGSTVCLMLEAGLNAAILRAAAAGISPEALASLESRGWWLTVGSVALPATTALWRLLARRMADGAGGPLTLLGLLAVSLAAGTAGGIVVRTSFEVAVERVVGGASPESLRQAYLVHAAVGGLRSGLAAVPGAEGVLREHLEGEGGRTLLAALPGLLWKPETAPDLRRLRDHEARLRQAALGAEERRIAERFERGWLAVRRQALERFAGTRTNVRGFLVLARPETRSAEQQAADHPVQWARFRELARVQAAIRKEVLGALAEALPELAAPTDGADLRRVLPARIDPAWTVEEARRRLLKPALELAADGRKAAGQTDGSSLAAFALGGSMESRGREAMRTLVLVPAALALSLVSATVNLALVAGAVLAALARLVLPALAPLGRLTAMGGILAWASLVHPMVSQDPLAVPGIAHLVEVAARPWGPEISMAIPVLLRAQAAMAPIFSAIGLE